MKAETQKHCVINYHVATPTHMLELRAKVWQILFNIIKFEILNSAKL